MENEMEMSPVGQGDREALRELADAGNEAAMDRLADLADERVTWMNCQGCWTKGMHEPAGELRWRGRAEITGCQFDDVPPKMSRSTIPLR